jgi:hypothetical protein
VGLDRLRQEVQAGAWPSVTTDRLVELAVDYSNVGARKPRVPSERYTTPSEIDGDLLNYGLYEIVLQMLRKLSWEDVVDCPPTAQYPDGKRPIKDRSIWNVRTGRPKNPKQAENPDVFAKAGLWIPYFGMRAEQSERLRDYQTRRHNDSAESRIIVRATDDVLHRHTATTAVRDVWAEVKEEISDGLMRGA